MVFWTHLSTGAGFPESRPIPAEANTRAHRNWGTGVMGRGESLSEQCPHMAQEQYGGVQ